MSKYLRTLGFLVKTLFLSSCGHLTLNTSPSQLPAGEGNRLGKLFQRQRGVYACGLSRSYRPDMPRTSTGCENTILLP
jgi:hypothetical protein